MTGSNTKRLVILSPPLGIALLLLAWGLPGGSSAARGETEAPAPASPGRPAQGIVVTDSARLLQLLQTAPDQSVLLLAPGEYAGPILIGRGITLWGPPGAIIRTKGKGTTVRLHGKGSRALGFTILGSGKRYDLLDAALEIQGEDLHAEGLRIREALYGIISNKCKRLMLHGNIVVGTGQKAMGLRGDGIRIWETYDSTISDNRMSAARDMVVWYSSRNKILRNEVRGCRYGTHLMYSHGNEVRGNAYVDNVVGVFSMYSRDALIKENLFAGSGGSAGIGLGMKESSNLWITDNEFIGNERGMYFDNSPFEAGSVIEVRNNTFRFSTVALAFHEKPKRIVLQANRFRDNGSLLTIDGGGDALRMKTDGNDFDTYRGYDLDGDGVGDIPFLERSLSEQLISSTPSLALFRGTPASGMLEAVGRLLPLYLPKPILRDEHPVMTDL